MDPTEDAHVQAIYPGASNAGHLADSASTGGKVEHFAEEDDSYAARGPAWYFIGRKGLRAGWSVLIFYALYRLLSVILGTLAVTFDPDLTKAAFTAGTVFIGDLIPLLAIVGAVAVVARLEGRRILDYNLTGARSLIHFLSGSVAGFAALSLLVGVLYWGGWLHFGAAGLGGAGIFKSGAMWAAAFLVVGLVEEGSFRCYLQFTFTRGLNLWWALGIIGAVCLDLMLTGKGNGIWGVYVIAALGLVPCLVLQLKKTAGSGFWQAAWVTSTLFGFRHTANNGENWIGIFAVALIGFVFCVSVWATGSAWWAIGCHAAWDWAETYFYGAADSGNVATGHYLTTSPAGAALWSGGTDGPEGSVLVIPVVLLLMVVVLVFFRRENAVAQNVPVSELPAG
ncbi:MAG: CPBP family intramembrane glutamic endopeptidase [Terracidiphilus sp.]|jgi:hypothetical protein